MPEKTKLMRLYEEQNPGKNAIWRGKITNQFIEWKKYHEEESEISLKIKTEFEILLFLSISKLKNPTYSNIIKFCTSFNLKSNEVLSTILKKIRDDDIVFLIDDGSDLKLIYQDLFELENLQIPLTITVNEALKTFPHINVTTPFELIEYFKDLRKKYPDLVALSSSKHNQPEDLITFKNLFPNQVKFQLKNRWIL